MGKIIIPRSVGNQLTEMAKNGDTGAIERLRYYEQFKVIELPNYFILTDEKEETNK